MATPSPAATNEMSGMVWEKHGSWYLNGSTTALRIGEAVPPGALLTAEVKDEAPSAVILLPDGERLLCECYERNLCARGFRVPALTSTPSSAVLQMFAGVRNALLLFPASLEQPFPAEDGLTSLAGKLETVAAFAQPGQISLALAQLPAGSYTLAVAGDAPSDPSRPLGAQKFLWGGMHDALQVRIPGPGVYRMRVEDERSIPRLEIEVLVTQADAVASESADLKQVRAAVRGWSGAHPGWPLHEFLRAYLQSRSGGL